MPPSCPPLFCEQGRSTSSCLRPCRLATKCTLCFERSLAARQVQRVGPTVSQVVPCTALSHLVLIDVERDLLRGSVLPCLLLRNGVILAVSALEHLALPVRHIMRTSSRACPHRDGAGRRWFRSNIAPSPCLLRGLHIPCGILRVNCKLSVHDTAFCLQQTMECVQADTLCAATHPLVGVCESAHATK